MSQLNKIFKYLATGFGTFVVEYSLFLLLVYIWHEKVWVSQALSYIVAIIVNFSLLRYWAFGSRSNDKLRNHFAKYLLLVFVNLPVTTALAAALTEQNVPAFLTKIVVVGSAMVWNYLIYDKLIFKQGFAPEDAL